VRISTVELPKNGSGKDGASDMNYFPLTTEQQEWKDHVVVLATGDQAACR